ncbi:MAG: hypothetical protein ACRD0H_31490 [Actinomycetes bacterium]
MITNRRDCSALTGHHLTPGQAARGGLRLLAHRPFLSRWQAGQICSETGNNASSGGPSTSRPGGSPATRNVGFGVKLALAARIFTRLPGTTLSTDALYDPETGLPV